MAITNMAILIGRLGADPEMRTSKAGTAILKMRVATSERRKVGEQWEKATEWHNVVMFGRRAESVAQFLHKGKLVAIQGRLSTSSWDADDGSKRYRTEIIVDELELLGGNDRPAQAPAPQAQQQQPLDERGESSSNDGWF